MQMEPLERAVLEKAFEGEHPAFVLFQKQLDNLIVKNRQFTGSGFYTKFDVDVSVGVEQIKVNDISIKFGDVVAEIDGLQYGAGFLVYVENGVIRMLEGYSFEEPWPEIIGNFSLSYQEPGRNEVFAKFGPIL